MRISVMVIDDLEPSLCLLKLAQGSDDIIADGVLVCTMMGVAVHVDDL